MAYSVTLISSGQPSANPRLVKEAVALSGSGYTVTVVYVPISPWADAFDEVLFRKHPQIKFVKAGYHSISQKNGYIWARARRKILSKVYAYAGDVFNVADFSTILFGQELLKAAKQFKADLYIAHNLGALPVAIKVARKNRVKVGFDAEDFHRGEFSSHGLEAHQTIYLENKYLPQIDYLSVASPLIGKAYKSLFPQLKPVVLNNVFPAHVLQQNPSRKDLSTLSLFWFSQTVGKTRGIENIIRAMGLISEVPISLTLLGNVSVAIKDYLISIATEAKINQNRINFVDPVPEEEIFKLAAGFDIGIGAETVHCLNREYCLSNKIFTYLLAGNALVLSETQAQEKFLKDHPSIGSLYKNDDPESLAFVLQQYAQDRKLLKLHQRNARDLAVRELNWEVESKKLLNTVAAVLAT
ncbi:glycosyltransferase family protein [Pontibacter pamirensis]|uniref:glycosyltransferase family 4 protein n=1 Tax=Pontibacter pamirensis TaxID=2562824 RepID=UPI00138A1D86|nr:glycosyltransferase family 4 protein [Pontibacter pamirensis]